MISGFLPERTSETHSESISYEKIDSFCTPFFMMLRSESSKPDYEVFKKAMTGFLNLKATNNIKKNFLTVIDFSISSKLDRMWIIDMNKIEVIHACLVAHGQNSGEEFASHFSNSPSSNKSSLGFYLTGGTYTGKHGLSLYLDGVESGINDNARERAIVMHGADYVSRDFIRMYGRLGRSLGCPSIPMTDHEKIINLLSGRSCMYIHHPDNGYQTSSGLMSVESALRGLSSFLNDSPSLLSFN
jgi:hypothetical protein